MASKTQLDYLVDILCDYPGLLEEADNVLSPKTPPKDNSATWIDIVHQCGEKLTQLSEWQRSWVSEFELCRYEVDASHSSNISIEAGGPLFPSILYFTDIWRAYECCVHNALRILLLRLYVLACQMGQRVTASPNDIMADFDEIGASVETLATEICRSIDYFLSQHGQIGALLLMFPAQIALLPLDRTSDVAIWLMRVLEKISELDGLEIGRQILTGRCTDLVVTCR